MTLPAEIMPTTAGCLFDATEHNVVARRNLILGLSVGRLLGHGSDEMEGFAAEVIAADHREPGHDDVLGLLREALARRGLSVAEPELTAALVEAQRTARLHFTATD
ncbi:ATPase inhibitor subunit zeta [Azospirillum halopraeferens]|uniref:ATPase inhibitor subunit zeta n=1 Tax=Azospirillum halopraeferens TaxID=34010 RepID=UPI000423BAC8|nr:ATPase inhibitor subunit zeta [Azospirillum halopraeferens]